ncbi:MAG: hypothetical protein JOZ16_10580, partial [Methylobacteriaceae bacterium]|nr:hypothetical protein [Methylobacteriaceae bacterium]
GPSGAAIRTSDTLRLALTAMMKSGRTILPVADESGTIVGAVHVEDIVAASKRS